MNLTSSSRLGSAVEFDSSMAAWPRYSPDLNLIEHVWGWVKNYVQQHHWQAGYDVAKIPLSQLEAIIWEAWNAVPGSLSWFLVCELVGTLSGCGWCSGGPAGCWVGYLGCLGISADGFIHRKALQRSVSCPSQEIALCIADIP